MLPQAEREINTYYHANIGYKLSRARGGFGFTDRTVPLRRRRRAGFPRNTTGPRPDRPIPNRPATRCRSDPDLDHIRFARLGRSARVEPLIGSKMFGIDAVFVEGDLFGQPIRPAAFRDFRTRIVLRRPRLHGLQLGHRPGPRGRILRTVFFHQLLHQIGPFQRDAAARVRRRRFAKITQKL